MEIESLRRRTSVEAFSVRRRARQRAREIETAELRLKNSEQLRDWVRIALQAVAGLAVIVGLALTGIELVDSRRTTAQQLETTNRQLELTIKQLGDARTGQIADRFSRAVDQLGNTDAVDVRVGGIYSLESIARDSDGHQRTVAEVMSAFVIRASRSNMSILASEVRSDVRPAAASQAATPARTPTPNADVRSAITVIGRMYERGQSTPFDLRGANLAHAEILQANLRGANLTRADLRRANLTDTDLRGAEMYAARLRRARLEDVDLRHADLANAELHEAWLYRAVLRHADLIGAVFRGAMLAESEFSDALLADADLRDADLADANLRRAVLNGADLRGANLRGADLRESHPKEADLRAACYDYRTDWPPNFDANSTGAIKAPKC